MFDRVWIAVRAGGGGDGAISFRREKFVPFGGPDGGDGGKGGDVIIRADASVTDLREYRHKRSFSAENGGNGMGEKKHGKDGDELVLTVPAGTLVSYKTEVGSGTSLADLEQAGQQVVVAKGGKEGLGNTHFASSTNQAPKIAQKGETGEEASIILELRLIADIGIIGYPNVGKSTLLAAASAAKPEIANYPFTTREPVLGVVEVGWQTFTLAEIPGLIDGAHLGKGLGHDFLRHIVRTKALIHVLDGGSASLEEDMRRVNSELSLFDSTLSRKPQLLAVNKIDLPEVRAKLDEIKASLGNVGIVSHFIAAATGEGVPSLMAEAMRMLERAEAKAEAVEEAPGKIFHPQPRGRGVRVLREGDTFVVSAPEVERMVARVDLTSAEVRGQLKKQLERFGAGRALAKAGIKPGDKVRCGNLELDWW